MEITDPSHFGTITLGESEAIDPTPSGDSRQGRSITYAQGEWRPPERLSPFLPENFSVPLDSYTGVNGLRWIDIPYSSGTLIDKVAVGGLAVLHATKGLDKELAHSYREMFIIHQYILGRAYRGSRGRKEHLVRDFAYARDLYIRRPGRSNDGERDVLPEDLGLTFQGKGKRLSVSQLIEKGRHAARAAGYDNPTSRISIPFGFLECARLNPLDAKPEKVLALVRSALFDLGSSSGTPSEELIQIVRERFGRAIHTHLDEPLDDFEKWCFSSGNSIIKQIAQQKRAPGGRLSRDDVRWAMLHLGWQAYEYVGQCIHSMMRTIRNSVPEPFGEQEQILFAQMHESQSYYGGFPLVLLAERGSLLAPAIVAIWQEPHNRSHVRVLHRMLWYYADMAEKRRKADRESKRRSQNSAKGPAQDADGNDANVGEDAPVAGDGADSKMGPPARKTIPSGTVQFSEMFDFQRTDGEDPFTEVAEHIRQLHQIECEDGCTHWEYHRKGDSEKSIAIESRCECGHVVEVVNVSREEFTEFAETLLGWKRREANDPPTSGEEPIDEC